MDDRGDLFNHCTFLYGAASKLLILWGPAPVVNICTLFLLSDCSRDENNVAAHDLCLTYETLICSCWKLWSCGAGSSQFKKSDHQNVASPSFALKWVIFIFRIWGDSDSLLAGVNAQAQYRDYGLGGQGDYGRGFGDYGRGFGDYWTQGQEAANPCLLDPTGCFLELQKLRESAYLEQGFGRGMSLSPPTSMTSFITASYMYPLLVTMQYISLPGSHTIFLLAIHFSFIFTFRKSHHLAQTKIWIRWGG